MQPINRPPGPPYDPRSMGPVPAGIPPQMRPPQGFRSPQIPPGMPTASSFNRPPSGPPIQKMANMSLGPQMASYQGSPNPNQMNAPLSNGVKNMTVGTLPQGMPSINDPNISNARRENQMPAHMPGGHPEMSENSPTLNLSEGQPMQTHSPAIPHPDSSPSPHNFGADRVQPPRSTLGAQASQQHEGQFSYNSAVSQPGSIMSLHSPDATQPSTVDMPNQNARPIMSLISGTGSQATSFPGMSQPARHGQDQLSQGHRMQQPSGEPQYQSPRLEMPQHPGSNIEHTHGLSTPQAIASGMPSSHSSNMPPLSVSDITQPAGQSMKQSPAPQMTRPGMLQQPGPGVPQLPGTGMSQPHRAGMTSQAGHRMPQTPGPPYGQNPPELRMPTQASRPPGHAMPPMSSEINLNSPSMINQARLPHMPASTSGEFGMAPSGMGSIQGYPPSGSLHSFSGKPGAPPTSGISPRMPPQPGMMPSPGMVAPPTLGISPRMPPQSGMMSSPGMVALPTSGISPRMQQQPGMMLSPGMIAPSPSGISPRMPPQSGMMPSPGMVAPPTSGISPRMPPLSGMPSGMIAPPGSMSSPGMPPPNAGQQQYPPQHAGMQNRYPGATAQSPGMGGYAPGQGRKLNPDDMPSPLQVIEEDMQSRSGEFITNVKGTLPPLVTTDFYVTDGGNASPRFIRSTMYSIPGTPDLMKQAAVPFGLVISPMANLHPNEAPLYLGTSLSNGPVRCNRCKAYMSTLMMFMDGGRRFQCLLCKQTNEVPSEYYCHMDSLGARADKFQRPELCLGSFEYVATSEYCRDKILPKEPAFIFVLEMTQMMLQRGIISLICQNMKEILLNLPVDQVPGQEDKKSKMHVGFITYDSSVHFYKLSGLSPEMCVVCDKEGMFVPVPDGILCEPEQVADNIEKLMESIPQNFQTARETSGNLYAAINAGMAALKASGRAGKLFVFHSSLPHGEGVGKVKNREDRNVLGTEKEKTVLTPQNSHYNSLAQDLVTAGCGVDLYLFNESYIDIATLGQVCRLTGGQCHKYTYFTLNKDGPRLLDDLKINVGRNIAFEAVMRVRSSTGVRPVEFYGHFYMSNTHDVELAVVDSSKGVAVEIKHDDKLTEEDGVYVQTALLYTSCGGQRRLRIFNLGFNVCTQMADLFKSCDNDTLMNFIAKESMFKFLLTNAKQVKENLITKTAQILSCYRKNCASPSSVGQLILPELLKLLPLYINCLSKSDALSGGQDLTCDDRSWHIYQLCTMDVAASSAYLYPRLIPLSDADPQKITVPPPLRTSYDKLSPDGVFLLENGLFMFIWVGSGTCSTWMNDVFGVAAPHHLDPVISELPDLDNPVSKRVRGILDSIRKERGLHLRLFVVPQQGKHELVLRNYLVEDKGMVGSPSYVEFLCHIHKEVRTILS